MEKPFITDPNTPLSQTLGHFDFVPNPDDEIEKLQAEIRELKSRIAVLEQKSPRIPWWRRLGKRDESRTDVASSGGRSTEGA